MKKYVHGTASSEPIISILYLKPVTDKQTFIKLILGSSHFGHEFKNGDVKLLNPLNQIIQTDVSSWFSVISLNLPLSLRVATIL